MKIALARYREDQWDDLVATAKDPEKLQRTYFDWLDDAAKLESQLRNQGKEPVWVDFDIDEFLQWCKRKGVGNEESSRNHYVAERMKEMSKSR